MRFLPEILKEMLKNVPSLLFDVVDWKELTQVLPIMSKRILARDQISPLLEQLATSFKPYKLSFTEELIGSKTSEANDQEKKEIAHHLLNTYFQQLFNKEGQLLDFRSDFFTVKENSLFWKPNGIWAVWKDSFRIGLVQVYKGFYLEDETMFRNGLQTIGLIHKDWDIKDQDEMAHLFKNQFGAAITSEMYFKINIFKESFISIFHFLLAKKVRMSADFMYLGMMLVTLYLHLEELDQALPVKEIFLETLSLNEDLI